MMKKLLKPITWPLDLLYRFRTTYLFLTIREASASVKAAQKLDTAEGRAFVARLEKEFAELQRIKLETHGHYAEVKLTINVKALQAVDDETAVQVLAEIAVARIKLALDKVRERNRPKEQKPASAEPPTNPTPKGNP